MSASKGPAGIFGRILGGGKAKEPNAELKRCFRAAAEHPERAKAQLQLVSSVRCADELYFCLDDSRRRPQPLFALDGSVEAALDAEAAEAMRKRMLYNGVIPKLHLVDDQEQLQRHLRQLRRHGVETLLLSYLGQSLCVKLEDCAAEFPMGHISRQNLPILLAMARSEQYRYRAGNGAASPRHFSNRADELDQRILLHLQDAVVWLRVPDAQSPGLYVSPRAYEQMRPLELEQMGEPKGIVDPMHQKSAGLQPDRVRLLEGPLPRTDRAYVTWLDAYQADVPGAEGARFVAVLWSEISAGVRLMNPGTVDWRVPSGGELP